MVCGFGLSNSTLTGAGAIDVGVADGVAGGSPFIANKSNAKSII